jgi:hypothetical protein
LNFYFSRKSQVNSFKTYSNPTIKINASMDEESDIPLLPKSASRVIGNLSRIIFLWKLLISPFFSTRISSKKAQWKPICKRFALWIARRICVFVNSQL